MSAPGTWAPTREHRETVEKVFGMWRVYHPNAKRPADVGEDEWFREYAFALSTVTPAASVLLLCENLVRESPKHHWPRLGEVQRAVAEWHGRRTDSERAAVVQSDRKAAAVQSQHALQRQAQAIADGLGLNGSEPVSVRWRAIAEASAAVLDELRGAVQSGKLPREKVAEFSDGVYPAPAKLQRIVSELVRAGRISAPAAAA